MKICHTFTLTAANTGYSIFDLAIAKVGLEQILPRCREIIIQTQGHDVYLVPAKGAYANVAGVPNEYGITLSSGGDSSLFRVGDINGLSLDEFIVGSATAGAKIHVIAIVI